MPIGYLYLKMAQVIPIFYDDTKVVKDLSAEEVSTWQMISYVDRMNAPNGESIYSVLQDISYFCRPGYESFKQFYIGYYSGIDGDGVAVQSVNTSNSQWERVITRHDERITL